MARPWQTFPFGQREDVHILADLGHEPVHPAIKLTYEHLIAHRLLHVSEKEVREACAADYTPSWLILRPDKRFSYATWKVGQELVPSLDMVFRNQSYIESYC